MMLFAVTSTVLTERLTMFGRQEHYILIVWTCIIPGYLLKQQIKSHKDNAAALLQQRYIDESNAIATSSQNYGPAHFPGEMRHWSEAENNSFFMPKSCLVVYCTSNNKYILSYCFFTSSTEKETIQFRNYIFGVTHSLAD